MIGLFPFVFIWYLLMPNPGVRRSLVDARDPQARDALLRQLSAEGPPAPETRPRGLDLPSGSHFFEGIPENGKQQRNTLMTHAPTTNEGIFAELKITPMKSRIFAETHLC